MGRREVEWKEGAAAGGTAFESRVLRAYCVRMPQTACAAATCACPPEGRICRAWAPLAMVFQAVCRWSTRVGWVRSAGACTQRGNAQGMLRTATRSGRTTITSAALALADRGNAKPRARPRHDVRPMPKVYEFELYRI